MSQETSARTSTLIAVRSDSHRHSILSKFHKLRGRDLLCDVTLVVEDVHFRAHKALLAASSEYFSLMFTSQDRIGQSTFRLGGMAAKMFSTVLEFIYSAHVSLEENTREQLLAAAHLVGVEDLVKVLTELTAGAKEAEDDTRREDKTEEPHLSKRKKGRPKKIVAVTEREAKSSHVEDNNEEEANSKNDPDYDPEVCLSRQSKRKVRPPVKYLNYQVDQDTAVSKEPGKKGRKRKYPNTEARCEDCGKVFKNHLFLIIHRRTHTGEKPYRCQVCGKSFSQNYILLVHQRKHTGEKPFVCAICSKALCTKHSLQEHMNLHKGERSFKCDKCGRTFTQKKQLNCHYRVHTGKSFPECAECHHKFPDKAQLRKHLRTHTGEKPFTCEICGKCFTAKSTLQTHIRIHRGEKPYTCNICNKSFSDPSARRRHVSSHSGKKPFTCSTCNLSFTRLDNLRTHTKSHSKERVESAESAPDTAASAMSAAEPQEDADEVERNILQLQPYQLPSSSEQEIQLVVNNINFVHDQDISIITSEGDAAEPGQSRLTLLTQAPGHMQNVALVAQGAVVDHHAAQIQGIQGMLEGQVTQQPEQMHVITLSKEAMEQLQSQHGPGQQLQVMHQPVQQLAVAQAGRQQHGQAIHISSQSSQPISISQTSEQISSHHIQGQTFQIQAGTVSYLCTTGLPQES